MPKGVKLRRERREDVSRVRRGARFSDELAGGYAGRHGPPAELGAKVCRRGRTHIAHRAGHVRLRAGIRRSAHWGGVQGEEWPDGSFVSPGSGWETCMVRRVLRFETARGLWLTDAAN